LEGLIELKNSLNKRKNQKNKGQTDEIKTTKNLIEWWNWKKKNFNKSVNDTIRNLKKKEDWNEK